MKNIISFENFLNEGKNKKSCECGSKCTCKEGKCTCDGKICKCKSCGGKKPTEKSSVSESKIKSFSELSMNEKNTGITLPINPINKSNNQEKASKKVVNAGPESITKPSFGSSEGPGKHLPIDPKTLNKSDRSTIGEIIRKGPISKDKITIKNSEGPGKHLPIKPENIKKVVDNKIKSFKELSGPEK